MSLIRPFAGLRPAPGMAAAVIAPPYDVLSSDEARAQAAGKPWSFLHISKPEIDLPVGTDPYRPEVYAKGKEGFARMLADKVLQRDPAAYYYFYRLTMGAHSQLGLVAIASCAAYEADRIRKHEYTRPDKEDDRVRQIDTLNAQTGPVFLTYRHDAGIDALATKATAGVPDADVTAGDGVRHTLWVVRDAALIDALTRAFDARACLYICDGHHRSAAAARVAAQDRARDSAQYFLAVIFPDEQTRIFDYNRVLKDLNGLTPDEFLRRIEAAFTVETASTSVKPSQPGDFGMYLGRRWYRLRVRPERVPGDPVGRLDVSLLQDHLIAPILGITDPRRDKRIDFVGGIRGLAELERRVDSGEMALAFALYPTSLADLMAVADAGQVMPPKSTWFEPKLADGLVSHVLD